MNKKELSNALFEKIGLSTTDAQSIQAPLYLVKLIHSLSFNIVSYINIGLHSFVI